MDTEIRELERRWEATGDLEDLQAYALSLLRAGQTEAAIELLQKLVPDVKSQLLQFLGEPAWRKLVNDYYLISGTLYGFLFLPAKLIEEAEALLEVTDIGNWKEELANKIDFTYLAPQTDDNRSFFYHFEDFWLRPEPGLMPTAHYIEVALNSGSTNYWVDSSLWRVRSGDTYQDGLREMVSDPGETLAGIYLFEYIRGKNVFHLEILPAPDEATS